MRAALLLGMRRCSAFVGAVWRLGWGPDFQPRLWHRQLSVPFASSIGSGSQARTAAECHNPVTYSSIKHMDRLRPTGMLVQASSKPQEHQNTKKFRCCRSSLNVIRRPSI